MDFYSSNKSMYSKYEENLHDTIKMSATNALKSASKGGSKK